MIIIYPIWSSLIFSYLDESVDFGWLTGREGVAKCSSEPRAPQDSHLCPREEAESTAGWNPDYDGSGVFICYNNVVFIKSFICAKEFVLRPVRYSMDTLSWEIYYIKSKYLF